MKYAELREALVDMCWQYAYDTVTVKGRPALYTGGMSALEEAFEALGWSDPHEVAEEGFACEVKGCMKRSTCGLWWDGMYLSLCSDHGMEQFRHRPRPGIKAFAVRREKTRGPGGTLPIQGAR